MHNFTNTDLLLYVLGEANHDTIIAIEKAMKTNVDIKNEVITLRTSIEEIENFELEPNDKQMGFILEDLQVNEGKIAII